MSSSVVLKALGLNFSPNSLDLPNGSLSVASNIFIKRDNVVEQRRGYKLYGNSFGIDTDIVSQLFAYKERILRQYNSTIQFDSDGSGAFSSFSGSYSEAQTGLRTKSIESNGNFYFTSSAGIKTISAATASDFSTNSGYITNAGVPKAIDFTLKTIAPDSGSTGFLPQDSTVAYRTTWDIKDANNNLKIGSPSQSVAIYNPILDLLIPDLLNVLEALDNVYISPVSTSFFGNYGNYVNTFKLPITASSDDVRTNLINLATQIDNDIIYANDAGSGGSLNISTATCVTNGTVTITTSTGVTNYLSAGSKIYLTGFATGGSTTSINGLQTVTNVTATTILFNVTGAITSDVFTSVSGVVTSGKFRNYTQPSVLSIPATASQLAALQTYLSTIILGLQEEPVTVIGTSNQTNYISPLSITSTVNIRLTIQIPDDVTENNFFQIYRSTTVTATGTDVLDDLIPNGEEVQLVYEAYPSATDISNGYIIVDDVTPDLFKGANLYTNASTGEGILQANDIPPFALDINRFKNVTFYANTKTRHRIIPFSIIGVSNMVTDAATVTPKVTIATSTISNTYSFILGVAESTPITCTAPGSITSSHYFDINSANDVNLYRVWYDKTGSSTAPTSGGRTLVKVDISKASITTATHVAERTRDVLADYVTDFITSTVGAVLTILNVDVGYTTNADMGNSGFTLGTITQGTGESTANKEILLSQNISPAIAVDETSRSFVRVINANSSETIYAFYTSTLGQVPGKMVLESRTLNDDPFYLIGNNSNTGGSFFPDISPVVELGVSAGRISTGSPTTITSASHGLVNNDQIIITGSDSTPPVNGIFTVTVTGVNTFTIIPSSTITVAGTKLSYTLLSAAEVSQNEANPNRIYYSKTQQPEAVPIVNYLDVGAKDRAILRIFPLRDSLFVFKEDGLFRISGEVAPFYLSLFDSSCIVVAPDSVSISNNLIYAYTRQGISTISEAGVTTISRPIDTEILKISSSDYTTFGVSTWGIGYESDNSYTVFTVKQNSDSHATIGYRYSNLTNTWTTIDKDSVCGIVSPADDKLYLGAGDINYIEQERKSFSRLDYSDREISSNIANNAYTSQQIQLVSISGLAVGDVLVQEQLVTNYKFNALLKKLDIDPSVADNDYYSTLHATAGNNLRSKIVALASKLDADTGLALTNYSSLIATYTKSISSVAVGTPATVTTTTSHNLETGRYIAIINTTCTPSINSSYFITKTGAATFTVPATVNTTGSGGSLTTDVESFNDLEGCFNLLVNNLNIDSGAAYSNYQLINNTTTLESVITAIDVNTKKITLKSALDFVVGPITIFKSITSTVVYSPNIMGDPLGLKHLREATVMFLNRAFTAATISFSTDLLPKFNGVSFIGDGTGTFGSGSFGSGFFGGSSNSAPFRTYIPRNSQRCRYIVVKFQHSTARESYAIYGITLSGEIGQSTRAYR